MRDRLAAPVLVFGLVLWALSAPASAAHRVSVEDGVVAVISDEPALYLEALPERGEGLLAFSRRLCGTEDAAEEIVSLNGEGSRLLAGVRYRVPFDLLRPSLRLSVLEALFPGDRPEPEGWRHQVRREALVVGETLWSIAEWFTGDGRSFRSLREANGLVDDGLHVGQTVLVPRTLLRPEIRSALPPGLPAAAAKLEHDEDRAVAVYRLEPGEALYSSVVMRFTGRVYAEDVNALAEEIAAMSGIPDVTDIPVGYRVRIPFELLLPEYLPEGHPRREEYEASLSSSTRFANRLQARHLDGVTVVLDAGHGGNDPGASMAGVWESLYVYDIMVRIKRILEERTAAEVVPTIRDGDDFRVLERDVLPYSRGHRILTDPPYSVEDSRVGVNLRWYLANSVYRKAIAGSGDPNAVVFVSIHSDSLHPSLRGAMVYVPSARLTAGRSSRSGVVYASRREVREQPAVEFSWKARTESEGLSRQLAQRTIEAFEEAGLLVHEYKPIRDKIIRRRREFVPAVLRYNGIPAKVLVEVCNLANDEDRRLLQSRSWRERVALAIVDGILGYYGEEDGGEPAALTAARR